MINNLKTIFSVSKYIIITIALVFFTYTKINENNIQKTDEIVEKTIVYEVSGFHKLKSGRYVDLTYKNHALSIEDSNLYIFSKKGDKLPLDSKLYYNKKTRKLDFITINSYHTEFYH